MRALFNPQAAQGLSATIGLHLGESAFTIEIADARLQAWLAVRPITPPRR